MKKRQINLIAAICIVLCITIVGVALFANSQKDDNNEQTADAGSIITSSSDTTSSEPTSSDNQTSGKNETTSSDTSSKVESKPVNSKPESTTTSTDKSHLFPGYKYTSVFNIEDNVFIDSLVYTGYNLAEHKADGLMWQYVLSKYKKGYGWLSNITFGGGSTGLETTSNGLPDISFFEKKGLVCASFASYVYFNYLPNVAKIDTSALEKPEDTKTANSFYQACKKWVKSGQSYNIGFKATNKGGGILFEPEEEIPIGSIIVFRDMDKPNKTAADHITIYVGEKNGYHWVIQTGNKNGPEFCAVERFKFGPDPQWPLAIFATPTCIYDAAGEMNQ